MAVTKILDTDNRGEALLLNMPDALQLEQDIRAMGRGGLVVLDLPGYHEFNAANGRRCFDVLLCTLRDHILSYGVPGGLLYRMENARFCLLVPDGEPGYLKGIAQRLVADCTKPWALEVDGQTMDVIFTVAVALFSFDPQLAGEVAYLSSAVEYALENAAHQGGIVLFDAEMNARFKRRVGLERDMRKAVLQGMEGFFLRYQPIVDPGTSLWKGLEALCRWHNSRFGEISPKEFIPIAEETGMISPIGLWVLETAIRDMKSLGVDKAGQFVLDVNVSPLQLAEPDFGHKVLDILEENDYLPEKLCLEITESSEVNLEGDMPQRLLALYKLGVHIALDDFGVGYASLSSLYKLPVDTVKTDRSLVLGVEDNEFLQRLFYLMTEVAHACDMKIVAEGVETDGQLSTLLAEGADYIQGFRFFKPLELEQVREKRGRFFNSVMQKPMLEYTKVDITQPQGDKTGYYLPPDLFRVLNRCMQVLFTNPDEDEAIDQVLAIIGQKLRVSRATVFMRNEENSFSIAHQWCAKGVVSGKGRMENLDINLLSPLWKQTLRRDSMLVVADAASVEEGMRGIMARYGVTAMAEFALWRDKEIMGLVCFEDCRDVRYWTREELRMLYMLGNMLAGVLMKTEIRTQTLRHSQQMRNILDSIDAMIYVANPRTGEILFANSGLLQVYGASQLAGKTCWEEFFGRDSRCEHCPVKQLMLRPAEGVKVEFYNEPLEKYVQASNVLIPWDGGEAAVLSCSFNITEIKRRELALEESAFVDPLTRVLNRAGFYVAARALLEMSDRNKRPATLAFLDVDGLKQENDLYGHQAGDRLLCTIVASLQARLRGSDLIGRYGGDEFVLLFYDCRPRHVEQIMESILEELAGQVPPGSQRLCSFSYGLADFGEKSLRASQQLEKVIGLADQRMLECKRTRYTGGRGTA